MIFLTGQQCNHYYNRDVDMNCINCGSQLSGRQKKYCSRKCKNTCLNINFQSYQSQQERGRKRKLELIRLKGKCCERCGYSKNYAALEFHHKIPREKLFQLDLRSLSNRKWDVILEEAWKCMLLCSNCHAEEHNPECVVQG